MKFFKFEHKEGNLKIEESRESINWWLKILLIAFFFLITGNIKNPETFHSLAKLLIGANITLLIALAVNDMRNKLTITDTKVRMELQTKIENSLEIEKKISFQEIEKKLEEYEKRRSYYDFLLGRIRFSPIKNILISAFLTVFFVLFYGTFSNLINTRVSLPIIGGQLIYNIILMLSLFVALYYFLVSLVFVAQSLFAEGK